MVAGGQVTFLPPAGFIGTVTVPYTVTDAGGGTASSTITFTVDPPGPAATDDDAAVAAGDVLTVATPGVLSNDTGTGLTVTGSTLPGHGTRTLLADGSYTYAPDSGFSGVDAFDYTVTDALGRTAVATVTITVTPSASPDTAITGLGAAVTVVPVTNDLGLGLTVTSVGQPAAGEGSTSIVGGQVVYTPGPGFTGSVTVPYTVTDATGNAASSTITITVVPAPGAAPDSGTTPAGTALTVVAPGLLSNDNGTAIVVVSNTAPGHGSVAVQADGAYVYTPDAGYSGPDTFDYTITDSLGQTASATVSITVTPVARDDQVSTPHGTAVVIHSLTNDTGRQLTITATGQPSDGTTTFTAGSQTYTPPAGFSGSTTFTYAATDASGQQATATVTVTVAPASGGSNGGGSNGGGSNGGGSTSNSGADGPLAFTGANLVPMLGWALALGAVGCVLRLAGSRRARRSAARP